MLGFFSWYPLFLDACISADAPIFEVTSMACKRFVIPARHLCIAVSVRKFCGLLLGHKLSFGGICKAAKSYRNYRFSGQQGEAFSFEI